MAASKRNRARDSRLLVVDTCVVRAAGETKAPISEACREALQAILKICHRVIITPEIMDEWRRHMSRFSRVWFRSMHAKKKFIRDIVPSGWTPGEAKTLSEKERQRLLKDVLLIQAALAADRIILTNEHDLAKLCRAKAPALALPSTLRWCIPTEPGDRVENL